MRAWRGVSGEPPSEAAGPASVFPGVLASEPPGELFFRAGDDAQVAALVLEAGHLEDGRRVAGPVSEFRLEQEQVLRSRARLVHKQLRMSKLADRAADRKGQVVRPGVGGVDRPARWDPLANGATPRSLAAAIVPLGDVVAQVRNFQAHCDQAQRNESLPRAGSRDR